jgi:pyruvate,orthophosphate dikinase
MSDTKYVYFFGGGDAEGDGSQKTLLGGKGAGLASMTSIGLPCPPGFTLTTETCGAYYDADRSWPAGLEEQVRANVKKLEELQGKTLGDADDPLLVAVRSGASVSMPGMMETILNLGLNDVSVKGLAAKTNNKRFAYDGYRRLIQMYGTTAMDLSKEEFEHVFEHFKETKVAARLGRPEGSHVDDTECNADELEELCEILKAKYQDLTGASFPQDPWEQLAGSIDAVFNSWMAEKAVTYRRVEKISETLVAGTGVNVQTMVYGNKGETSGTGVAFTRDPNSGANEFYGDYLFNAQGEDVVAGIRTPVKLTALDDSNPQVFAQLMGVRQTLEKHYKDMQDVEFTVEEGTLYMLQTRRGKRTPTATFRIAVEMVNEGLISKEEAVSRITAEDIERLFYPDIDPAADIATTKLGEAINAVPGAAAGKVYFTAEGAEEAGTAGERVILVRKETSPEDVGGMHAARGILTQTGGKTSHAAVVARGWGKCCIVGCGEMDIDYDAGTFTLDGVTISEGDYITLDGSTGAIYKGDLPLIDPTMPAEYEELMGWVDEIRKINVRTNADSPADAAKAIEMGAEGIGLCRTEHMFFETQERRDAIQAMIVADTLEDRVAALNELLPFQRGDFEGIYKVMDGRPVTVRLVDPPLHEFVPHDEEGQRSLAAKIGKSYEHVARRVEQLHEFNPMLGHRGCRLSITYPEILDMQVRAIMEAACNVTSAGVEVHPEIMIPLVIAKKELQILADRARELCEVILSEKGLTKAEVPYLIGTMIEMPRAALTADKVAEVAEFFSFGTNDLTQTCMGLSRDDAGRFLPDYVDEKKAGIFAADPFQVLDQEGVGQLVQMGLERGRSTRPNLKVGICGEHGGEMDSVKFCARIGMNYVSCSPYRVPIARLAAAQQAMEG